MDSILFILFISVIGPIIGSLIGVFKKPSDSFTYNMLAFAAGVMISVSFLELIPESIEYSSVTYAGIGILLGSITMFLIDKMIPHLHPELCNKKNCSPLKKTSIYLILGIFIHNFPEGLAIAIGVSSGTKLGLVVALAIAVQNIPEGICTSYPYYYCTKKRLKSFLVSASTIIPIIIGFFIGYMLYQSIPLNLIGILTAATAGVMIYISTDELIPCSCFKMTDHSTIFSFIIGVVLVIFLGLI